ncbi:pyridoxal phosphate-dependent aminotransferase [Patescibacteria group bacterium]|nr:pyridoxal phosphate-dependent aminotransferase [Patescibacteria group bacterium]MBU1931917.1 pyridoxal phosphate-dependent aminotransferase [Patescibacteria group bacterium]
MRNQLIRVTKTTAKLKPEGAYAVLAKAQALEAQGKKIIHLEIGQPDFPTPKPIARAAIAAIEKGLTKYNPPLGVMALRQAVVQKIKQTRKVKIKVNNVAITPSTKAGIFIAMTAVIEPGDEVIYPDPGFPTYRALIDWLGAVPKPVPLLETTGFSFDMRAFKKTVSKKTRLIIINSPSNPTGGIIPKKDLKKIAELSRCWILSDEIYSKILYDNQRHHSIISLPGMKKRTILLDGFSKSYSMTGWRLGYMVFPQEIEEKIDCLLTHSIGCSATFTQYAGIKALKSSNQSILKMVKEFKQRRNFVVKALNEIPGVKCQNPTGAFYVFPNIKSFGKSSKWLANYLLEKAGVALLDGTSFGKHGEGYLRISYATSMDQLKTGLEKIKQALAQL